MQNNHLREMFLTILLLSKAYFDRDKNRNWLPGKLLQYYVLFNFSREREVT
jgi:hypothetical protein